MIYDAIIIGSGQSGLAAGYYLKRAGLSFAILEAGEAPGGSWPYYYDSLRLNTPARYSSLPGLPFPGAPDQYPVRDQVVEYLRSYATHFRMPVITATRVRSVEQADQHFHVRTSANEHYVARTVIAATGSFGSPYRPPLAGQDQYRGQMLHIAEYRRAEPFRGQRVVIVGGGNGAVRVGAELATTAHVTLATRNPIHYQPQRIFGRDIHFWLRLAGSGWYASPNRRSVPVYADRAERTRLVEIGLEQRPMFMRLDANGVVWPDGGHEAVDAVLFATGYRPDLAYLSDLGAFDSEGRVLQRLGRSTSVPGLYFVGLAGQRTIASATLRGAGPDARIVAEHLRRYCLTPPSATSVWPGVTFQVPTSLQPALVPVRVLNSRHRVTDRF